MNKKPKLVLLISVLVIVVIGIAFSSLMLLTPRHPDYFTKEELKQYDLFFQPVLVIKPLLTANAYGQHGFYNYYNKTCDKSCLTVQINKNIKYNYMSSKNMINLFHQLNASMITDYDLHDHTDILNKYKEIIVLHSEYVPFDVYDALQNHTNVVYLYPNSLYADVKIIGDKMTLYQGHHYPYQFITNGFGWKYDNSALEPDWQCKDLKLIQIDNGYQLNCYPEKQILNHKEVFSFIKNNYD